MRALPAVAVEPATELPSPATPISLQIKEAPLLAVIITIGAGGIAHLEASFYLRIAVAAEISHDLGGLIKH